MKLATTLSIPPDQDDNSTASEVVPGKFPSSSGSRIRIDLLTSRFHPVNGNGSLTRQWERSQLSRSPAEQSAVGDTPTVSFISMLRLKSVQSEQPSLLILTSIQTIKSPEISGVQGSSLRPRVTVELMQLAKTNNAILSSVM